MKPGISVVTLAVSDLDKSVDFYREGLGFAADGIVGREFEHGAMAFFELEHGLRLALWPRKSLADGPPSHVERSLGHNVSSVEEVDGIMAQAARAGARLPKPGQAHSGVAMPAASRTRTVTLGRSSSILPLPGTVMPVTRTATPGSSFTRGFDRRQRRQGVQRLVPHGLPGTVPLDVAAFIVHHVVFKPALQS